MTAGMTQTHRIHFSNAKKGKRKLQPGPAPVRDTPAGRVPRVSRLVALAIKFDGLLGSGAVRDQAELAELGHVTRARVTQIMNLLHLAPDIQDELLHASLGDRASVPPRVSPGWYGGGRGRGGSGQGPGGAALVLPQPQVVLQA